MTYIKKQEGLYQNKPAMQAYFGRAKAVVYVRTVVTAIKSSQVNLYLNTVKSIRNLKN